MSENILEKIINKKRNKIQILKKERGKKRLFRRGWFKRNRKENLFAIN